MQEEKLSSNIIIETFPMNGSMGSVFRQNTQLTVKQFIELQVIIERFVRSKDVIVKPEEI